VKASVVPFIALRYLKSKRGNGGFTPSILSVVGVAVGVMTLIVVLSVMNGFQLGFIENMVEIGSYHLQLQPADWGRRGGLSTAVVSTVSSVPGVLAVVPFAELQALFKGVFQTPLPCMIRAVPEDLLSVDPIQSEMLAIQNGAFSLAAPDSIVIGSELSKNSGATVGDAITIQSMYVLSGRVMPVEESFTVSGIFRCGYLDYDERLVFVSPGGAERLAGSALPVVYGVKLSDRFRDVDAAGRISPLLVGTGYAVESWRLYNKVFFGALFMEKLMIFVLEGLIFVVVGFNIYHSLRRTVFEKKEEIAVLKAVGIPPRAIQYAFVFEGFIIGTVGAFAGILLGMALAMNVNGVFFVVERVVNAILWLFQAAMVQFSKRGSGGSFAIFSPMYFYLQEVPSRVLFPETFLIALFASVASIAAAYAAARSIVTFRPAEILRYE
jgi:lipoprotein-releasing system permease protein